MDQFPMAPRAAGSRDAVINIRVKHRQRELIDRAADTLGRNRSEFMLDAPPRDIPALRSLLTSKPVWED